MRIALVAKVRTLRRNMVMTACCAELEETRAQRQQNLYTIRIWKKSYGSDVHVHQADGDFTRVGRKPNGVIAGAAGSSEMLWAAGVPVCRISGS